MLGTDDDEPPTESGPDDGIRALARDAAGDSVTADRLRGDAKYFPDCRPALQEGQQPHHLILLTKGPETFEASAGGSIGTYFDASTGGVALLTEETLLVVVDGYVCEVPYAGIQGCLRAHREIEVYGTGDASYALYVARSADDAEVTAGFRYLRRRVRERT